MYTNPNTRGDSVLLNILSCTQIIIPTGEKVNDTQVNSSNPNSTQETNLICEIVNDTQDSNTNLTNPQLQYNYSQQWAPYKIQLRKLQFLGY